jgi:DNA modification methylase
LWIAAKKIGRDFIGIEKSEEYVVIAEARLKATPTPLF